MRAKVGRSVGAGMSQAHVAKVKVTERCGRELAGPRLCQALGRSVNSNVLF